MITHYLACLLTESVDNFIQYITPILRVIFQQLFVFSLQSMFLLTGTNFTFLSYTHFFVVQSYVYLAFPFMCMSKLCLQLYDFICVYDHFNQFIF